MRFDIDPREPLFPQLDNLPDEHHRLAYFIADYVASGAEEKDTLVQEFSRLGMDITEPGADIPDMVRSYCELQCTSFPKKLASLMPLRSDLKREYGKYLEKTTFNPKKEELDPLLPDEQPDTAAQEGDSVSIPPVPSYENALVRLGYIRDRPVTKGLSSILKELGAKSDELLALNNLPDQGTMRYGLFDALVNHFNLSEIQTLCFSLGIQYEDLEGGEGLTSKARELVDYCTRRERLPDLEGKILFFRPSLSEKLKLENRPTILDVLIAIARQTIDCIVESLTLFASFYGRWIASWDEDLSRQIMDLLRSHDRDLIKLFGLVNDLNQLSNVAPVQDVLQQTFLRDEIVSLAQVRKIVKHIIAYEHYYLDIENESMISDFYASQCPEETRRLIAKASEFINYLKTGITSEEATLTPSDKSESPKSPIVPEVVYIQRRMTLNDGITRIDCQYEDGHIGLYRFAKPVYFYFQEESFFYIPRSATAGNTLVSDPIIFPVDVSYPIENKL